MSLVDNPVSQTADNKRVIDKSDRKKHKKSAKAPDTDSDAAPQEEIESVGKTDKEKKKKKKEKKEKEKLNHSKDRKQHAVDGEGAKEKKKVETAKAQRDAGEASAPLNTEESTSVDDHKKRQKKRKLADEEKEGGESHKKEGVEKKKKRKKGKADEDENPAVDELTKKSKRDKRKADADDLSLVEGESGKKEKKQKKSQDAGPSISAAQSSGSYVTPSDAEVSAYLSEHSITIDCGPSARPNNPIQDNLKPALSFSAIFPRIPESLHEALSSFKEPTPIQACSWPAMLEGRDVVGIAETGSGKTLAFGIPAVSGIVKSRQAGLSNDPSYSKSEKKSKSKSKHNAKAHISVLALAPTRELALQTHETFTSLGAPFGLTSVALYGGVDKDPQRRALVAEGAAMVVGTPGRILDLLNEGACDLSGVTYLVLDEADRMLDKGFENDIRAIISHTGPSEGRQTLMFSATWPEAVRRLASSFLRDPIRVTVGSDDLTANRKVEQVVEVFDDQREKDSRLISHLRRLKARKGEKQIPDEARILIFVLYKKEAARVEQNLGRQGFSVIAIHGDLSQSARIAALDDFKSGRTQLLVATDVAARGLDIPNVGTVINYSFPLTVEDYIHRIGRTGRGGHSGKSITFFTGDNHERALAGELAKVLRESGFDADPLKKFPMTIKKKTHSVYGAFFRSDIPSDVVPTRIKF